MGVVNALFLSSERGRELRELLFFFFTAQWDEILFEVAFLFFLRFYKFYTAKWPQSRSSFLVKVKI